MLLLRRRVQEVQVQTVWETSSFPSRKGIFPYFR